MCYFERQDKMKHVFYLIIIVLLVLLSTTPTLAETETIQESQNDKDKIVNERLDSKEQEKNRFALKQLEIAINEAINESDKEKKSNNALVAIFLDTEDTEDAESMKKAEYECRIPKRGGGSGLYHMNYRIPWIRWEPVKNDSDDLRVVMIDPGLPYKVFKKAITLFPGEVVNFGRIVLRKTREEGTSAQKTANKKSLAILYNKNISVIETVGKYPVLENYTNLDEQEKNRLALKQLEAIIDEKMSNCDKNKKPYKALVAFFLDTEDPEDAESIREAVYRCYYQKEKGGGYSGNWHVPYRASWTRWENTYRDDAVRKIVIDPGPPYETFKKDITLIPGGVTNLGRIILKKVKAEGTVTITGTAKDEEGNPLENVKITSSKGTAQTDAGTAQTNAEGKYRIEGFGLGEFVLWAQKKGYVFGHGVTVSIRDMKERIIVENLVFSYPKKVKFTYVISNENEDNLSLAELEKNTYEFIVDDFIYPLDDESYYPFDRTQKIKEGNFKNFVNRTGLKFINYGKGITLDHFHGPIFYKILDSLNSDFISIEKARGMGSDREPLCPPINIKEGSIILIDGAGVSPYTLKILFEEIKPIIPEYVCAEQDKPLHKESMPHISEDILWISSIPLGADVFVFEKKPKERFPLNPDDDLNKDPEKSMMQMHSEENSALQHTVGPFSRESVGKTPLKIKVPAGTYCIGVQLDVASENIPFQFFGENAEDDTTKLFSDAQRLEIYANLGPWNVGLGEFGTLSPYLYDRNLEFWGLYSKGYLKKVGKTYEVEKKGGEASTVIALFQRKDKDPDEIYNTLPKEYRFNERSFLKEMLEIYGAPKGRTKKLYQQVLRGGKAIVYDSQSDYILVELLPLGPAESGKGKRSEYTTTVMGYSLKKN